MAEVIDNAVITTVMDTMLMADLVDHGEVVADTPSVDPPEGGWAFDQRYTGSWVVPDLGELAIIRAQLVIAVKARIIQGQAIHIVRTPYLYQWEFGWGIRAVFGPP